MSTKYIHYSVPEPMRDRLKKSLEGISNCKAHKDKTGVKFTLEENYKHTKTQYFSFIKLIDLQETDDVNISTYIKELEKETCSNFFKMSYMR